MPSCCEGLGVSLMRMMLCERQIPVKLVRRHVRALSRQNLLVWPLALDMCLGNVTNGLQSRRPRPCTPRLVITRRLPASTTKRQRIRTTRPTTGPRTTIGAVPATSGTTSTPATGECNRPLGRCLWLGTAARMLAP